MFRCLLYWCKTLYLQPTKKKGKKKIASAPLKAKKALETKKAVNPLFEKRAKNFGIGKLRLFWVLSAWFVSLEFVCWLFIKHTLGLKTIVIISCHSLTRLRLLLHMFELLCKRYIVWEAWFDSNVVFTVQGLFKSVFVAHVILVNGFLHQNVILMLMYVYYNHCLYILGQDIQPKRDLSRFVKWPKYIRLQRQKAVLYQRLKVPPPIHQFTQALDRQTGNTLHSFIWY